MISILYYTEICKNCDFSVLTFDIIRKITLKYNSTTINFSTFIINHPENKLNDKRTFLAHNTDVSTLKRGKIAHPDNDVDIPEINMLIYLPKIISNQSLLMFLQKRIQ